VWYCSKRKAMHQRKPTVNCPHPVHSQISSILFLKAREEITTSGKFEDFV